MADPVPRRRIDPEIEETAIAVQGALPERNQRGHPNQWALWRGGNTNQSGPPQETRFESDSAVIHKLRQSGLVDPRELCSYRSPDAILGQDNHIAAINSLILQIINNMAISRRMILDFKLKGKSNSAKSKEHEQKLLIWPAEVRRLQSKVEGLGGRFLRVPALLLTTVGLQQ